MDSQCPGCLGQAVVTLRLPCAIVESPRRHKRVPFVNIAFLRSRSIKRRQWEHKLDYHGVVFAHLATGSGIKAKDPSGLDSDRWIPHSRCCENPARAKALAGFSRHLSAGFTDLNPAPRGLSLYNRWYGLLWYDFGNDRRRRGENFVQKYYVFKEIYILTSMITWVDYIGMYVLRKIFMCEKFSLRVSRD